MRRFVSLQSTMDDLLDLNWSQPSARPPTNNGQPSQKPKKQDAFADLLNLSSSRKEPDLSKLTLAEQQRLQTQSPSRTGSTTLLQPDSAWLTPTQTTSPTLSASPSTPAKKPLGQPSSPSSRTAHLTTSSNKPINKPNDQPFEQLLDPFSKQQTRNDTNVPLNAMRSRPLNETYPTAPSTTNVDQWNFDLLESRSSSHSQHPDASTPVTTEHTFDDPFDLTSLSQKEVIQHAGFRGTDDGIQGDDNPLGILAQPVTVASPSPPPSTSPEPTETQYEFRQEDHVKPDSILSQLIDMGFALEEAQMAVEITGGEDLQAAIDMLIQNAEASQASKKDISRTAQARQALFDENVRPPSKSPAASSPRQQGPKSQLSDADERSSRGESPVSSNDAFQQHKERIVAQASELGGFLYKNASIFVKTGREKLAKAVEDWQQDQQRQTPTTEKGKKNVNRPKWMTDGYADDMFEDDIVDQATTSKFVDDDLSDHELEDQQKRQQRSSPSPQITKPRPQQKERQSRPKQVQQEEEEEVYISPSRRRGSPIGRSAKMTNAAKPASPASSPSVASRPPTTNVPPPKPKFVRPVVSASADVLAKVNDSRKKGNEHFKLGQFSDAEQFYTQAIEALPENHDHLVILYNNRAAARLKTGDHKKSIEDSKMVIHMARSVEEARSESQGLTIVWADQLKKALLRHAEALENTEKYADALKQYEELLKLCGTRDPVINQGLARCRKAIAPSKPSTPVKKPATPSTKPKPEPSPAQSAKSQFDMFEIKEAVDPSINKSKAVAAMRAQAMQQEAEEAERLEKTDNVNLRLNNWKAGKENNLRALLATLDTLLWPGAQWRGTQMSELIEPKKCKITYLKAIAKVHPDKLPSNVTIEQRMLASGIFTVLNEAWDSFKAQNF
ncbi:uncharacterized protein BYT42DRAFT_511511 [Radiomyces spectabilis]|uniref:uncharacterized protein n=1 Tax=Radiomyces spectabilis TaxID=64574 RepID=UPI00221F82AD|nr:uncharacterized protein BYT42DRAFT_511511 [Radiomyces spectabilis]KAI8388876.1 hypothetical protein BYT42DRAFT_511511 [Radiomyces spectabilis]